MAAESFRLSESGSMSTRQRARFLAETRAYLVEKDRAKVKALREALAAAEKRQREALRKVVTQCQANRHRVRGAVKKFREQERERINLKSRRCGRPPARPASCARLLSGRQA